MARGRFISKCITADKTINELSDDLSSLAFTWLITFADAEGRTYGDPIMVKSMLFPRRTDITPEKMAECIGEWADAELIIWYEANDERWIQFNNFEKHQVGLRKDREPQSEIPAEGIRINAGSEPEDIPLNIKLREVKVKDEVKLSEVEVNAPSTSTSSDPYGNGIINVISKITGHMAPPANQIDKIMAAFDILRLKYPTNDELINYLSLFYDYWKACKTKDGRPYSPLNYTWLTDWAVTGEIPGKDKIDRERAEQERANRPPAVRKELPEDDPVAIAWSRVIDQIHRENKVTYDTWMAACWPKDTVDGSVIIGTPSEFAADWLNEHMKTTVEKAMSGALNKQVQVEFRSSE